MPEYISDHLTRSAYKGYGMQQREEAMVQFAELKNVIKPKRFLEIGTGQGGLTYFLSDTFPESSIYSFEDDERRCHVKEVLVNKNAHLIFQNIFKTEKVDWKSYEVRDEWVEVFNESPKVIICDGGNKIAEFNGLAKYLKEGDIIMLHDYSTNEESFNSLKVWNWLECQYSDIKTTCEVNNLQPFMHNEFLNCAWGCFRKGV